MSIDVEKNGAVTTVVINRPQARNAVDRAHSEDLSAAFRAFEADDDARVAVLTGADGHFCAGADLKAVARRDGTESRLEPDGDGPMGPSRLSLTKPVIGAIAGYAVGGGLELALWCDMRIAEEGAILGVLNRRLGIPLVDGGSVRLPRMIGMGRALDLILTGQPVAADEALAIGLVNRVVPDDEARPAAERLAHELAELPQACLRGDRKSSFEQWGLTEEAAIANEFRIGKQVLDATWEEAAERFLSYRARPDRSD